MSSFLLLETTRNAALYRKYSDQAYVTNLMSVNQKTTLQVFVTAGLLKSTDIC